MAAVTGVANVERTAQLLGKLGFEKLSQFLRGGLQVVSCFLTHHISCIPIGVEGRKFSD